MDTLARGSRTCLKGGTPLHGPFRVPVALFLVLFWLFPLSAFGQKYKDVENIGKRNINKGSMNFFSIEKEISWGRQLAQQVELISPLLHDTMTQEYVDSVVQRLVRNSDAFSPFTVKIIDSREINAFALPGGFIYVNTGLIVEAQSESELAGILAHEIAHVTARHATKQMSKGKLFKWLTLPLLFVGGGAGAVIQQGLGLAGPLTFLKFKRNAERDADLLGLQYAYRAGYDPAALIDILERLGNEGTKNRLARLFTSHPMNAGRIKRAQKGIAEILPDRSDYVVSTAVFDRVRGRLERHQHNKYLYDSGEEDDPRLRRRTQ